MIGCGRSATLDGRTRHLPADPRPARASELLHRPRLRRVVRRARTVRSRRHQVVDPHGHRPFLLGRRRPITPRPFRHRRHTARRPRVSRLLEALIRFPKPLLAAVNGLAVGFGCTMLLYADPILVAKAARLRLPFTALGIVPEAGSSALLPTRARFPGRDAAALSSEWIDAEAAVRSGLAWRVVDDDRLLVEALEAAGSIAALDPSAVAATKRLMTAGRKPSHTMPSAASWTRCEHSSVLRQLPTCTPDCLIGSASVRRRSAPLQRGLEHTIRDARSAAGRDGAR